MCSTEENDKSLLKKQIIKCFSLKYNIRFCLLNDMYSIFYPVVSLSFDELNWLGNQHIVENDEAEASRIIMLN